MLYQIVFLIIVVILIIYYKKPQLFYNLQEFPKIARLHKQLYNNYPIIKNEIKNLDNKKILDMKIGSGDIYFQPDKLKKQLGNSDGWTIGHGIKDTEWTQYPIPWQNTTQLL